MTSSTPSNTPAGHYRALLVSQREETVTGRTISTHEPRRLTVYRQVWCLLNGTFIRHTGMTPLNTGEEYNLQLSWMSWGRRFYPSVRASKPPLWFWEAA